MQQEVTSRILSNCIVHLTGGGGGDVYMSRVELCNFLSVFLVVAHTYCIHVLVYEVEIPY